MTVVALRKGSRDRSRVVSLARPFFLLLLKKREFEECFGTMVVLKTNFKTFHIKKIKELFNFFYVERFKICFMDN